MGKLKFFKCPKCSTLLQINVELPEDNEIWPFVMHYKHTTPDNNECDINLAIDNNYNIREIGKEGLDEKGNITETQTAEEKNIEDLDFKVIKDS